MSGAGSGDARFTIATNEDGRGVAALVSRYLGAVRASRVNPPVVRIATAYFNPAGWALLAEELEAAGEVRLLLGAEPEPDPGRPRPLGVTPADPARAAARQLAERLTAAEDLLRRERDLLGFHVQADELCRRLVAWLERPQVSVRRFEDGFLHGKALVVNTDAAMVGSSNLTHGGLATNRELNLADYDPRVVADVAEWFDTHWERAVPFDLAALYRERFEPHPPWVVFLRMLHEQYGADTPQTPQGGLAAFQADGVQRARRHLGRYHGVLIADDVGLGKTYMAGEILDHYVRQRRNRALVIAPAVLRDGPWRKFLYDKGLGVEVLSFEEISTDSRLNPDGDRTRLQYDAREYALVVIDEAHHLRNPDTRRARAVARLVTGLPRTDVVLLTATPVNNSLMDVYWLLRLFIHDDSAFADRGIRSLRDRFRQAMARDPEDLTAGELFEILDAVSVRRTRSFIRRFYPNDRITIDGVPRPLTFPTPRLVRVDYDLTEVLPGFFDRLEQALDGYTYQPDRPAPDGVLTLARYQPSLYRRDRTHIDTYEIQLAGLLRSALLKRFESSAHAFAQTCHTMARAHDGLLALIDEGKVATGRALVDWLATDTDNLDEIAAWEAAHADEITDADEFHIDRLREDITRDRQLLLDLANQAEQITADQDPKLAALCDALADIAAQAATEATSPQDERDKRKVLVFTYYRDTVTWIHQHLVAVTEADPRLAAYRGRIAAVVGDGDDNRTTLFRFAPRTTDAPDPDDDRYDLLVCTDVLAEGVNLQQARHIINYDLPWNPMRIAQRHGRIDRIGSPHTEVWLRCFFPDRQLEALLDLEARLHRKLAHAHATFGAGHILPGIGAVERDYADTRDQILRLRDGDTGLLNEADLSGSYRSEVFRQLLRQHATNTTLINQVRRLPWGAGSGFTRPTDRTTWVFCARVGDHPQPQFRLVEADPETGHLTVTTSLLASLANAEPPQGPDTPRHLPDDTLTTTYAAWEAARDDIKAAWDHATDPANLEPEIPKAFRDAADLIQQVLPPEDADPLVDRLLGPWPERAAAHIRHILHQNIPDTDKAHAIAQAADDLGLTKPTRPEPLPPITTDDIHLICWLAITPT